MFVVNTKRKSLNICFIMLTLVTSQLEEKTDIIVSLIDTEFEDIKPLNADRRE